MEKIIEIGIAEVGYDQSGFPIAGEFKPSLTTIATPEVMSSLLTVGKIDNEQQILSNAQTMMANWFLNVENVEIADRDKYQIKSEITSCTKYPNGIPAHVIIKFVFATV